MSERETGEREREREREQTEQTKAATVESEKEGQTGREGWTKETEPGRDRREGEKTET